MPILLLAVEPTPIKLFCFRRITRVTLGLIYLFTFSHLLHVSAVDWRSLSCLPPMKGVVKLGFMIILYS